MSISFFGKGKFALPETYFPSLMYPGLLVIIQGLCYSFTIAPDLTWAHFSADGGDLISAAASGGVPHPSGYPLYLILARGFQFLPFGTLAFRTNLLSALSTILCVLVLYAYISNQLSGRPWATQAAFLGALSYGLAPFVWGQALVTEVYALHGLLLMLCIHVLSIEHPRISEGFRGFLFGIAATNHLTAILIFPLLVLGVDGKLLSSKTVLMKRLIGMAVGFSLYLTLPVRAYFSPAINWGGASSLDGFWGLVSGQIYGQYFSSLSLADLIQRLRAFGGLLSDQYTWVGVILGIYGLISSPPRRSLIQTAWMGGVFLLFAMFYGSYDSHVYLLPVWLSFAVWLAYGVQDVLMWLPNSPKLQVYLTGFLFLVLLGRIPFLLPDVDASSDHRGIDFITQAVQVIPVNALVFVDGDEQIFSLWYVQFALNQRLDMAIVATGLLPYPWYSQNLRHTYSSLHVPQSNNLLPFDLAAANASRAICNISGSEPFICTNSR